jgi:molecular chaperone DnaJ
MAEQDHYQVLNIRLTATQAEIKQAYRLLVKQFHPDVNHDLGGHDAIAKINAAYEVLGDHRRRETYDRHRRFGGSTISAADYKNSRSWAQQKRTVDAQQRYQQQRQTQDDVDTQLRQWLKRVYNPVNRRLREILNPLTQEISDLAADPFDDELMADFQAYLEDCRDSLSEAQQCFASYPTPTSLGGVAAHLYYCLNHVGDGIEELETFTLNYDDHYLHIGQELFRIAQRLRKEAQEAMKQVPIT